MIVENYGELVDFLKMNNLKVGTTNGEIHSAEDFGRISEVLFGMFWRSKRIEKGTTYSILW
jgi:hypothetical protein